MFSGVAVILRSPDGKVLVMQRDDDPLLPFANKWTLPGGSVEDSESPDEAIIREIEEELGIRTSVEVWKVYVREGPNGILIEQHVYVGSIDDSVTKIEMNEGQQFTWIASGEIGKYEFAYGFDSLLKEFYRIQDMSKDP